MRKPFFELLEQESDMPQNPEPVRAIDLLGLNNGGKNIPDYAVKTPKYLFNILVE